jgi:tetratricopeptide (TPR) repeat protein
MIRSWRLATALMLASIGAAGAPGDEELQSRARMHFQAGETFYKLGNYREAVREWAAGYDLVPKPEFLIDLGQAYRQLDDLEHAHAAFRKYLAEAPASDRRRPEVAQIDRRIEEQLAARRAPATPAERPRPPPAATGETAHAPAPIAAAPQVAAQPPRRRIWPWVLGAVLVAAAAGGIALGVALGTARGDPQSTIGTFWVFR